MSAASSLDVMADPPVPTPTGAPVLVGRGLSKSFSGARALLDVDIALLPGEVHVLFGENGAGKSTLINILAGALRPDEGSIELNGRPVHLHSVSDARRQGIAAVFQEFSLAPDLSVADNIFLGIEPTRHLVIDRPRIRRSAAETLARLGFQIRPDALVSSLSRGQQQMVEIAKAMTTDPKILILDEPTASLTDQEAQRLFALVDQLKQRGVAIIYITHRIAEIERIGNVVTVLRDGRKVAERSVRGLTANALVELMIGRAVSDLFPTIQHRPAESVLSIDGLSTRGRRVRQVSLNVRAGEIVGIAGLVGCGKSEVGRACFGIERVASGTIRYVGEDVTRSKPKHHLRRGLCYVTSDRRREGLLPNRPVRENISLAGLDLAPVSKLGVVNPRAERALATRLGTRMQVKPFRLEAEARAFSGGNQQKILLARYLAKQSRVFILDEPTIGIDVGTRSEIYLLLEEVVRAGAGVLLISSDMKEILNLCHRVYVMHEGSIRAELAGELISERNILASFFDVKPGAA